MKETPGQYVQVNMSEGDGRFVQMLLTGGRPDLIPLPSAVDTLLAQVSRAAAAIHDAGERSDLAAHMMVMTASLAVSVVSHFKDAPGARPRQRPGGGCARQSARQVQEVG